MYKMTDITEETKKRKLFMDIIDYEKFLKPMYDDSKEPYILKNIKLLKEIENFKKGTIFRHGEIKLKNLFGSSRLICYYSEDTELPSNLILYFDENKKFYLYTTQSENYYSNLEGCPSKDDYLKSLDFLIENNQKELSFLKKRRDIIENLNN